VRFSDSWVVSDQDHAYVVREFLPETEPVQLLERRAGCESDDEYRHRNGRHAHEEFDELPAGDLGNQEVLRFADQCAHAPERRADGGVHHEAP
jgi:hypothetical protein